MTSLRVCLALLLSVPALACAWTYSPVITVSELQQAHGFQHLESSGNRSIAISQQHIAVTWEDNHRGTPAVYIAFKAQDATHFSRALRVSEAAPAYEPAVAGLADGRFIVVWEANDRIWARLVSPKHSGPVQALTQQPAREATVTAAAGQVWLAWAAKAGRHYHIVATAASVQGDRLQLSDVKPVDPAPPKQDQLYPTIAITRDGTIVGWEDRRYGHTRLFTAVAAKGKWFAPLRQLNQLKAKRSMKYGNGTGAMRVVLASNGQNQLIASWLDKRDFVEGYDVYAAMSRDGGQRFGRNEKVEDMLGSNQTQWHAVSAMDRQGHAVVAWDDRRDGSPDVWFSWQTSAGWSDDDSPAPAHGDGSQTHPAMVFDAGGRLHLVFLDQGAGTTAIRYLVATPSASEFTSQP